MPDNALYIVATPIGNLADISNRAVQVLKSCDIIVCEDTRHSGKLLQAIGAGGGRLMSYHDHSADGVRKKIIALLQEGSNIALISDAGTPLISDPGYRLVNDAIASGVRVVPLPGACGIIAALSASGLPTDRFTFVGFAPHKKRDAFVESLEKSESGTVIFYESPERLSDILERLAERMPDCRIVIARELTKLYEEILRGSVAELRDIIKSRPSVKGEVTVLLSMTGESGAADNEDIISLLEVLLEVLPLRSAVDKVAAVSSESRNKIYELALQVKNGKDN